LTRFVKRWSIELVDHLGTTRQITTGQRDKKTAEAIGRNIERLVRCRVSGEPLDPMTSKWLEGVSPKLRTALVKFGLLDAIRMAALRPLTEHVLGTADTPGWKQYLASKGNTPVHVNQHPKTVLRAFSGTGAVYWSDLSATRLMMWLNEQRIGKPDAKRKCERRGIGASHILPLLPRRPRPLRGLPRLTPHHRHPSRRRRRKSQNRPNSHATQRHQPDDAPLLRPIKSMVC